MDSLSRKGNTMKVVLKRADGSLVEVEGTLEEIQTILKDLPTGEAVSADETGETPKVEEVKVTEEKALDIQGLMDLLGKLPQESPPQTPVPEWTLPPANCICGKPYWKVGPIHCPVHGYVGGSWGTYCRVTTDGSYRGTTSTTGIICQG